MYTREVAGRELELRVSGKLYKDALVMLDRETGTLWTQVDGSALRGPLVGHRLVEVPALQTTWRVWQQMHPDTLVLRKPENIRNSAYAGYSLDPDKRGLFGTRGDSRLEGKALIIGVGSRDDAVAIPVAVLEKQPLVEVTLSGEPLLVFYSRQEATPAVFRATLNSRQLSFHLRKQGKEILLEDNQTHSTWSPLEGRATAGPLMGQQLARVPYFHSYWYAWSAYRPKTRLVGAR